MAVKNSHDIRRAIHSIENNYFRSKFEPDLPKFEGGKRTGVISDYDAQPLAIGSHLGTFAIVTVGRINNMDDLVTAIGLPREKLYTHCWDGSSYL
jgi:amidophosphoribosyltransferase